MAATAEPRQEQAIDSGGVEAEILRYTSELTDQTAVQPPESHAALLVWKTCHSTYPRLAPLAEDFISAPASQATLNEYFPCVVTCPQEKEIVHEKVCFKEF